MLVWFRTTCILVLILGLLFHTAIGITMRIFVFTQIMPVFYLCFLEDEHIVAVRQMIGRFFRPRTTHHPLVLFDGVCNLCNASIQHIIRNDPSHQFRFAPLQSKTGVGILNRADSSREVLDTMILVEGDRIYQRSSAVLRIAKRLRFPLCFLAVFLLVPPPIRDAAYRIVANNRYRWFGKKNTCMIPTPELEHLFVAD